MPDWRLVKKIHNGTLPGRLTVKNTSNLIVREELYDDLKLLNIGFEDSNLYKHENIFDEMLKIGALKALNNYFITSKENSNERHKYKMDIKNFNQQDIRNNNNNNEFQNKNINKNNFYLKSKLRFTLDNKAALRIANEKFKDHYFLGFNGDERNLDNVQIGLQNNGFYTFNNKLKRVEFIGNLGKPADHPPSKITVYNFKKYIDKDDPFFNLNKRESEQFIKLLEIIKGQPYSLREGSNNISSYIWEEYFRIEPTHRQSLSKEKILEENKKKLESKKKFDPIDNKKKYEASKSYACGQIQADGSHCLRKKNILFNNKCKIHYNTEIKKAEKEKEQQEVQRAKEDKEIKKQKTILRREIKNNNVANLNLVSHVGIPNINNNNDITIIAPSSKQQCEAINNSNNLRCKNKCNGQFCSRHHVKNIIINNNENRNNVSLNDPILAIVHDPIVEFGHVPLDLNINLGPRIRKINKRFDNEEWLQ